ncbi:LysM peptidoglycan-binding domain-containing protein [Candidatus Dojkabacteria bacterium]|nr:LysM peptidoglycan-binding domain-containing protein [Candidatus Dojkabacteria bacterium]
MVKSFNYRIVFAVIFIGAINSIIAPVNAIEYGGLGGRPANPRPDNPRTDSIFIHTLETGAVQEEGVMVINNTPSSKTILVYAADSTPSTGGAFACKQLAEDRVDVGAWITLEKNELILEPATNEVIPFTINVPKNADIGEHNGCILIQEKKETVEGGEKTGVNLSFRTGLRVAITIPGEIIRKLEIEDFKIETLEKSFMFKPQVRNTGNVSIDADVKVYTDYFFGKRLEEQGGQYPILRGNVSDWNFELAKPFWGGYYKSKLIVGYNENVESEIGKDGLGAGTVLTSPEVWFFSFPSPTALVIETSVLVLVLFGLFIVVLTIKRNRWISKHWVVYRVRPNQDINEIAKEFKISWKLLAKVNKLKAPYVLSSGDKIKVPPQ